jgi:hypothetical protein
MKAKLVFVFALITLLAFVIIPISFAQEGEENNSDTDVTQIKSEPETQWRWGEVVSLDVVGKSLAIKYLDFESDQEKELPISIDESTTFESFKSLDELKIKDALSIDYIVVEGKNIAKNISLEKPESAAESAVTNQASGDTNAEAAPQQPEEDTSKIKPAESSQASQPGQ